MLPRVVLKVTKVVHNLFTLFISFIYSHFHVGSLWETLYLPPAFPVVQVFVHSSNILHTIGQTIQPPSISWDCLFLYPSSNIHDIPVLFCFKTKPFQLFASCTSVFYLYHVCYFISHVVFSCEPESHLHIFISPTSSFLFCWVVNGRVSIHHR